MITACKGGFLLIEDPMDGKKTLVNVSNITTVREVNSTTTIIALTNGNTATFDCAFDNLVEAIFSAAVSKIEIEE